MNCKNCGANFSEDTKFCPVCGTGTGADAGGNTTQSQYTPPAGGPAQNTQYQQQGPQYNQQQGPQYNQQGGYGQPNPGMYNVPPGYQQKSKMAAGLLGIFLGSLGIHNFYLGFTNKAVLQLILGIFSCGSISGIWGLIEGIMILTGSSNVDGNGVPLAQ